MEPAPYCICTVITERALEAVVEHAEAFARGVYRDTHPWLVASELLERCLAAGQSLPLILASGHPIEFTHWALITDIDVQDFHHETRCEFTGLSAVNPIFRSLDSIALYPGAEQLHREAVEPVTIHRHYLDEHLIHPYAIAETPAFVRDQPEG